MKLSDEKRDILKRCVLDTGIDEEFEKARKKAFQGDRSELDSLEATYGLEIIQVARNLSYADYQRFKRVFDRTSKYIRNGEGVFLTLTFREGAFKTKAKTRRVNVARTLRSLSREYVGNIDFGSEKEREHYHALFRFEGVELKNRFVQTVDRQGNPIVKEDGSPLLHKEGFYKDLNSSEWKPISSLPGLARWVKLYGFVVAKVVASREKDARASSKYVGKKMVRHDLKASTSKEGKLKSVRLIFSKPLK